jgi:hypothetical protein
MVRIVNYEKKQKEDGKEFFILELQGGIELVMSHSGQYYATAKKAKITSTFDEQTCKSLIGSELKGHVIKVSSEPYQYTIKETGETVVLTHKYVYTPEEINNDEEKAIEKLLADENAFSKNGQHKGDLIIQQ